MKPVKIDDGQTLWFNWNEVTMEELEKSNLDRFDVFNVPEKSFLNSDKYFITYFNCKHGNCAMFLRKRMK